MLATLRRRPLTLLALLLATFVVSSVAWARSGGSFGGGFRSSSRSSSSSFRSSSPSPSRSFGSSSSSSFRSSSAPSPAPSYHPSSYGGGTRYVPVPVPIGGSYHGYSPYRSYSGYNSYGSHSYSRGGFWAGLVALVLIGAFFCFVVFLIVLVVRRVRRSNANGDTAQVDTPSRERCDVWLLQFGIQMQAREIQDTLDAMANKVDTDNEDSLAYAVRTVAQTLETKLEFVEYASVKATENMPLAKAEDQFQLWAGNERAKFNREVVRAGEGGVRHQQKEWKTDGIRDEDGQFAVAEFFVLSVVLATKGVQIQRTINDHTELTALLQAVGSISGSQLVALEVVWSPAARSDAMSRDDMTSRYPTLAPV